ncbi:MAG: hypothetical protein F6K54_07505 [Okeania sp. SIO3B5]|nr:hypothetical protein [Okeania sp. SIO3B5]NEO52936.1 hypothetical protein [Okeania sp. SIO3B5]
MSTYIISKTFAARRQRRLKRAYLQCDRQAVWFRIGLGRETFRDELS